MDVVMPINDFMIFKEGTNNFKNNMGRLPNYYNYKNKKVKILKKDYLDGYNRAVKYYNSHNKTKPGTVTFHNAVSYDNSSKKTALWLQVEKAIGTFNTVEEAYKRLYKKDYLYYYNDVYPRAKAIERLRLNKGLNCADISQIMYAIAVLDGRKPTYYRGKFGCGGHIWITLDNSAYNKKVLDGAAALKNNYSLGKWLCSGSPKDLVKNPAWLISDDGIT